MIAVERLEEARTAASGVVGLVPTMGFLHEGHLSLIEASARDCDTTIVTIFVNPLQFSDPADLERYPRNTERDSELAATAGADIVVVPTAAYMYPPGSSTTVSVARVSDAMEGEYRPGHFDGVATVVAKLFAAIQPDSAYFGRKDAQQLAVIRTMARDLSFPIEVAGMPLVREHDGLALSSRNVRLGDARHHALAISRGLMEAADIYEAGCRSVPELTDVVRSHIEAVGVAPEYVTVADAATADPMDALAGTQVLAVAASFGGVRLIDNLTIDGETHSVDRGTRLTRPSILYGGT